MCFDINQPKSTQYESKVQFDEIYRLVPDLNIFDGIFIVNFFTTEDHYLEKGQTYREISILDIDY